MLGSAMRMIRGRMSHDRVRASEVLADLRLPTVNMARLQRPLPQTQRRLMQALLDDHPELRLRATIAVADSSGGRRPRQAIADELCMALSMHGVGRKVALGGGDSSAPTALEFLINDVTSAVEVYSEALSAGGGLPLRVNVKLEAVHGTTCPRWHADTVSLRLLCTYVGAGTLFVENRHVKRGWRWATLPDGGRSDTAATPAIGGSDLASEAGDAAQVSFIATVDSVDERHAKEAGAGDFLLLKGHAWPGKGGNQVRLQPTTPLPLLRPPQGGRSASAGDSAGDSVSAGDFYGLAAVHRSPDVAVEAGEVHGLNEATGRRAGDDLGGDGRRGGGKSSVGSSPRLLLTVDDVLMLPEEGEANGCGCGLEHAPVAAAAEG